MDQGLFRKEVIGYQGERLNGNIILSQPVSYSLITTFIASLTFIALFFLWTNDYHRKQEIFGYLMPDKGLITMNAPRGGRVISFKVEQDQEVLKGESLFEVQVEEAINDEDLVSEQALQNLLEQEEKLLQKIILAQRSFDVLQQQQDDKRQSVQTELEQLNLLLSNQNSLLNIKYRAFERAKTLHQQGLISTADYDSVHSILLEQQNSVQNFVFKINESEAQVLLIETDEYAALINNQRKIVNYESEISQLQAQRIRLNADNINEIQSPVNAKVLSVNASLGQHVSSQQSVVSLIPDGSVLQAELYIPTRAIAFIKKNQEVMVRFDAFPYQKFGVQKAWISNISRSIISPEEISHESSFNEPVYRVIATLESQTVEAFGEDVALRSGMILSADVMLEERSLLEWLLEPLFSIKGKL